jgi:hypothetical protein
MLHWDGQTSLRAEVQPSVTAVQTFQDRSWVSWNVKGRVRRCWRWPSIARVTDTSAGAVTPIAASRLVVGGDTCRQRWKVESLPPGRQFLLPLPHALELWLAAGQSGRGPIILGRQRCLNLVPYDLLRRCFLIDVN